MPVVPSFRALPFLLLFMVGCLSSFTSFRFLSSSPLLLGSFGGMLFLSPINSNLLAAKLFSITNFVTKSVEHGTLSLVTSHFPVLLVSSGSSII